MTHTVVARVSRIGKVALWIYTCHLLVYTAGVASGGIFVATALVAARQAGAF